MQGKGRRILPEFHIHHGNFGYGDVMADQESSPMTSRHQAPKPSPPRLVAYQSP